ncbi:glucose 1-dehydrogenase [Cadophora sp. MPI-SDFR-AT-0126]|nr:glucose 1-dehydrogenase [Leotiomycetes sp. MPI-SDFR-AT-0126]
MALNQKETAYVTGGASGIGKALVGMLAERGIRVCIADFNIEAAEKVASELNQKSSNEDVWAIKVDVSSWDSQATAFEKAIEVFERIDYVFPVAGIGEKRALPNRPNATGPFEKPDLAVMDVDGTGMIYTIWLGVQHFRRQKTLNRYGFKGKIICVSSICGIYVFPASPVYSAAKYAVVGFVRTYGVIIAQENITLNAVCPGIVETGISAHAPWYHAEARKRGCLVEMSQIMDAFSMLMGGEKMSGQCVEVVAKHGARVVNFPPASKESDIGGEISYKRNRPFHDPVE